MGKKKAFIDKKSAKSFKLIPEQHNPEQEEKFIPTKEHLEEQHKYGVYFDDDYDYMKHMKSVKNGFTLQSTDDPEDEEEVEERVIIRAPAHPFPFGSSSAPQNVNFFDDELEKALEGDFGEVEGDLDDNFIEMAGGIVTEGAMMYRQPRREIVDSDFEDEEEDNEEEYSEDYGYDGQDDEEMEEEAAPRREGEQREIDDAFDKLLEADYNEDQLGELDGDDENIAGMLEPDDGRLKRLAAEVPKDPEYEEKLAKDYVRQRMALIEAGVIKDTEEEEIVEVDESSRKRMKWDCESFASQYSNIYNRPTLIKDANTRLSRKNLKRMERLERESAAPESIDEEMEEGSDDEVSTVSTFRPRGETAVQRKLRKQAVKEAKRCRRVEKKANKVAFAEEYRKVVKARIGQVKSTPIA